MKSVPEANKIAQIVREIFGDEVEEKRLMQYVMGLLVAGNLDDPASEVLLTLKNRPDWQRGLWNGIGGKVNVGEEAISAMIREAYEETGVTTMWREFAVIECMPTWRVTCYVGAMPDNPRSVPAINNIGERLEWWGLEQLPDNRVGDLRALVELARKKLVFGHARISYRKNGVENDAYLLKNILRLRREESR